MTKWRDTFPVKAPDGELRAERVKLGAIFVIGSEREYRPPVGDEFLYEQSPEIEEVP